MLIYLDLDGVMADFDAAFHQQTGRLPHQVSDDHLWQHIHSRPTFFRDLPTCHGALPFFRWLLQTKGRPIIITACPDKNYAEIARQKKAWVAEHLMEDLMVLPVRGGPNKALFMHRPGDILIDDFIKNCDAWTREGGVAIPHRNFVETKQELNRAFAQFH